MGAPGGPRGFGGGRARLAAAAGAVGAEQRTPGSRPRWVLPAPSLRPPGGPGGPAWGICVRRWVRASRGCGAGRVPPHRAARSLLSPSLPGTGEARATACAPQAPEPCADGLSKSVSDGVLVLRQQLIKVLILENKKAGVSKLPLAGFCLGQPALPQTFYPVCWRCSGWAGAACGVDAQLRPSCHSVHRVTPHR